jgi:hypothetical protein
MIPVGGGGPGFHAAPSNRITGFGLHTELDAFQNIAVDGNDFYQMVIDFNHVHDIATFIGTSVGLTNVVIKSQHTTDANREVIATTSGGASTALYLNHVVLDNVEFNTWVWKDGPTDQ